MLSLSDSNKVVIVTGANGFIGRYVVDGLNNNEFNVVCLSKTIKNNGNENNKYVSIDLTNHEAVSKYICEIDKSDVFIHLAADTSVPGDSYTSSSNIKITQAALDIAVAARVKHFIYVSSVPVIGEIIYTPIDEKHPVSPKTPYHYSKYLGEKMLDDYKNRFDVSTIIRIPSPIGVGMRLDSFVYSLVFKIVRNMDVEIYGSGKRIQSYIDVRDVAHAILNVIRYRADGLFLVAGERPVSNLYLAEYIKGLSKSKSRLCIGLHDDNEEKDEWIISTQKANNKINYSNQYSLEESLSWIINNEIDGLNAACEF